MFEVHINSIIIYISCIFMFQWIINGYRWILNVRKNLLKLSEPSTVSLWTAVTLWFDQFSWFVLFYGVETLFGSFNTELNFKKFSLV